MSDEQMLIYRIGVGKALGLIVGLIGFFVLPLMVEQVATSFRVGVLFWYITLGALIGMFGVFAYHPILKMKMPWWLRGAVLGGWMNFVLVLVAYPVFVKIGLDMFGAASVWSSPWWMVLEGCVLGLLMDLLLTTWFGEGWKPGD